MEGGISDADFYIPAERHELVGECASSVQIHNIDLQVWVGWSGVHIGVAGEGVEELVLGLDMFSASAFLEELRKAIDEYAEVVAMRGPVVAV